MMLSTVCPHCIGRHERHTTAACFTVIAGRPSRNWREARADRWEGGLIKSQAPTPLFQELEANFFRQGVGVVSFTLWLNSDYKIILSLSVRYSFPLYSLYELHLQKSPFYSLFTSTTPLPFSFSFFLYMYQRYSIHSIGHANLHLFPFFFLFLRLHFHISSRVLLFFYWLFRGTD